MSQTRREQTQSLLDWANANISMFPKQFTLTRFEKVLDGEKCIKTAISQLEMYHSNKTYHTNGCSAAYFRLLKLKRWLEAT